MRTVRLIEPEDWTRLLELVEYLKMEHLSCVGRDDARSISRILGRAIEIEMPDKAPDGPTQCRTVTRIKVETDTAGQP